jgi:tetratricopeptide (TPR) repeat protein
LIAQVLNAQPDLTLLSINLERIPQPERPPATLPEPVGAVEDDLLTDHDKTLAEHLPDLDKTARESIPSNQTTRPHIPEGEKTTVPHLDIDTHTAQTQPVGSPAPGRQADSPLVAVVRRLLAKNPHDRYGDASAVIRDLAAATGQPLPVETAATRESFLQAARFVGRAAESAKLTAALDEAIAGQGSAWLIGGESGVGKSRLLNEMRTRALVNGTLVLSGQAVSETGAPYQVWREPLRRLILVTDLNDTDAGILKVLVPDIANLIGRAVPDAPDLEPEQARKRLLGVLASIFHRQTQPIVLILEDLHWAGSESLTALSQIDQSAVKLLILGSYRNDESPDLPEKLPQMRTLQLKRLGGTDIAALSESMLGEAGRQPRVLNLLQRETEGNVFFLVEVVRALAEEAGQLDRIGTMTLPANVFTGGVQRIVQRRLGRVPETARPLLQVAAILGRQLDLAVLQAAAPDENLERWLADCNDAAVLEVHDEYWRFTHDKLREGVLAALDDSARPALHRQAALAVEAMHPDQVAALAYHWGMAGDTVKEMQYVIPAAEQANRVSAYQEAIAYFTRALALLAEDGSATAQRAALTENLGRVYARLSNYVEAVRLFQESLKLADEIGERAVRAASLCCLGNVARVQGAPADATRYYTDGLAVSREIGDRHTMAEALRGLARIAAAQGQYAEATQRSGESLVISREIEDRWGTAQALSDLALVAIAQGAHAEAGQRLEESLTIFREIGDRRAMASVLLNLAQVAQHQGSPGKATRRLEESLAISREIGDRWSIAATLNNLGYIALLEGAYDQAGAYLEESLALFREIGSPAAIVQTLTNLGHVASAQSKNAAAVLRFQEALTGSL